MEKYKYLVKNIGALTIGQFGTNFLVFLLVPIYTSILSTEDYGTYDLIYNTVLLLVPFLTLNIAESTLRFSIDNNSEKETSIIFF